MEISLVLSTQQAQFEAVALKGDFEGNITKIAGWGYDGVELAIREPDRVDKGVLAAALSTNGLAMPAIGTGQAWGEEGLSFTSRDPAIRESAIERIKCHVPLAAQFGAVIILGLIRGISPEGQSHERSMSYLVEALRECATTGAAAGVRFALEPLNRYETDLIHTVREGLDLVERVGAGNLGLLLDTFHMNIEEPSITQSIRDCGDCLFHFHVADSNRWYPGAGHIDFGNIFDTLHSVGYNGYVSGEFMPFPNADVSAQKCVTYLRGLLT